MKVWMCKREGYGISSDYVKAAIGETIDPYDPRAYQNLDDEEENGVLDDLEEVRPREDADGGDTENQV